MADSALRFVQDLVLGGTSGVIAKTCCAPLERIKIILQVQSANTSGVKVSWGFASHSGISIDGLVRTNALSLGGRNSGVQLIFSIFLPIAVCRYT